MSPHQRRDRLHCLAAECGFDRCGVAPAGPIAHGDYLRAWLDRRAAGSMGYLYRYRASRLDPRAWCPWARSVVVVALSYHQREPAPPDNRPRGRVAMYAWGDDYHGLMRERLQTLIERLRAALAEPFEAYLCVDTSAIVERELAAAAGVGWIGKNTLVLSEALGSYTVLGVLLTSLEIAADPPALDRCGSCTRCLDACPTAAFPAPYAMDPRRCISYLTIEQRGDIDAEFRAALGDWLFGCDICQAVCPFNRDAPLSREPRFAIRAPGPHSALDEIAAWDDAAHQQATAGSATRRASLAMWQRNAAVARENRA